MTLIPSLRLGVLALASAAALSATPVFAQNAAVVNGEAIPQARVDEFIKMLTAQGRPDDEQTRKMVRDELIARALFMQQAVKEGLQNTPEVKTQLENARQEILIRSLIAEQLKKSPISDDAIKAEYERFKKETAAGGKEFKAAHILTESEEDAKKAIERIGKGEKFADVAKEMSKDPGSATNGGDLGWNTASTFVPEFGKAMTELEKGKMTTAPVKSQFGWHVIQLEDSREAEPPPLDQVRPQLQQQLERQAVQSFQQSLREKAKVE